MAGCVEPGMRRIGVPFGPMIVVARLPLRRTVPGGTVFGRVELFPPTSWVVSRSIEGGGPLGVVWVSLSRFTTSGD